jgi:hypothetical protein
MPASGPRSHGARVHPRPRQGVEPWTRASAASGLVLATQKLDGITGWGATGPKKFAEPVALSSTPPTSFPLARTTRRLSFDLLALRARRKEDSRRPPRRAQGFSETYFSQNATLSRGLLFARSLLLPLPTTLRARIRRAGCAFVHSSDGLSACTYNSSSELQPTRAPCSAQAGLYARGRGSRKGAGDESFRNLRERAVRPLILPDLATVKPKNSPSRVRFRPPFRPTFRFRVRPPGLASSYSRPVLGAVGTLRLPDGRRKGDPLRKIAQFALFQFHLRSRSWDRSRFPPERTQATFVPGSASSRPSRSTATGAAAAPSTTSLQ